MTIPAHRHHDCLTAQQHHDSMSVTAQQYHDCMSVTAQQYHGCTSVTVQQYHDSMDCLSGSQYFSVLDMKSGYYQVELEEKHKERTAFTVGPLGFNEYNHLLFGMTNSPATYQRFMEDILGDYHLQICLIYLDDIIIFSRTYEEHVDRLRKVFHRIHDTGLKRAPKKCKLFKEKVVYVGHTISCNGIEPDPAKTETIRNWPTPKMPQDVRRFLGLAWYYRKLVKHFSKIAAPLTVLMPTTVKKKQGKRKQPSRKPWVWGDEQGTAFRHLKDILSSPPVLGYADYSLPFELHSDASAMTSGAVLYQEKDGLRMLTSLKLSQTLMYLCTLSTKNWTGRVNEHCIRTTCCRLGVYLLTLRIHPTSLMQPPSEDLYLSQERRHLMTQVGKNNHPVLPPEQIFPQT